MFSLSTSVFPCQYHFTIAPYSFIHLPPTLHKDFLPLLQFSPVSIIPPLLPTHSSTYHSLSIKFFSPRTSVFPCQYHSPIAPYSFIHLPPTLYKVFLPVLQFSPVFTFHHSSTLNLTHYHRRCVMLATDSILTQYTSLSLSLSIYIYIYTYLTLPLPETLDYELHGTVVSIRFGKWLHPLL